MNEPILPAISAGPPPTAGAVRYELCWDETNGRLLIFNGTSWQQIGGLGVSPAALTNQVNVFTHPQRLPAGSAASPGITPPGDDNTGLYFPGADQVAIATGGAARLTVNSTGVTTPGGVAGARYASVTTNNIANNTVLTITPVYIRGVMIVFPRIGAQPTTWGMFTWGTATPSFCVIMLADPIFATTTGILTGTTGIDGRITVSAHSNGNIYIENRRGSNTTLGYFLIGDV